MARTWPSNPVKRAALAALDFVGYALTGALRVVRRKQPDGPIKKILVIEPWQIGDVVLVTPLLSALREKYPDASVTLLAKPHASEILAGSDLVDEIVEVDLPWTRPRGKYRGTFAERRSIGAAFDRLKAARYDLVLDARGDPRTHLFAALIRARRRIGFDLGGGWLLTHALKGEPEKRHKVGDWLELLTPLGAAGVAGRTPRLAANLTLVANARLELEKHHASAPPVIAFHPGASHAGKTWPLERFSDLARRLRSDAGGSTVVFIEPGGYGEAANWPEGTLKVKVGLADLMAYLKCCDLLVCNDSGPMHLADALGVPLVAVFERGNPQWFGPSGPNSRVVSGEHAGTELSPAPVNEPPANPVAVSSVLDAALDLLAITGRRAEHPVR